MDPLNRKFSWVIRMTSLRRLRSESRPHVDPVQQDPACVRVEKRAATGQGGLARAGSADDGHLVVPAGDGQVQVRQHHGGAVAEPDCVEPDSPAPARRGSQGTKRNGVVRLCPRRLIQHAGYFSARPRPTGTSCRTGKDPAAGRAAAERRIPDARGDVRGKIEASVDELDQTVRMLRDAIFGLEQRPAERGLRQEITDVCALLSPAPEISFSGPVDALGDGTRAQLVDMLTEALGPVRTNAVAARIDIAAEDESCRAVIEAGPGAAPGAAGPDGTEATAGTEAPQALRGEDFGAVRDRGAAAGIRVDVEAIPDGLRVAWQIPRGSPVAAPRS